MFSEIESSLKIPLFLCSFKPNYLSKISPTEEQEFVFGSVSNSPTVLTERFRDLYDKERAAAFSELSQILGEKATIRHLLWIIAVGKMIVNAQIHVQ